MQLDRLKTIMEGLPNCEFISHGDYLIARNYETGKLRFVWIKIHGVYEDHSLDAGLQEAWDEGKLEKHFDAISGDVIKATDK